jgi:hypothetical protein
MPGSTSIGTPVLEKAVVYTRSFLPFRPIEVSPLGVGSFFSEDGLSVTRNEIKWLWLPSAAIYGSGVLFRRLKKQGRSRAVERVK